MPDRAQKPYPSDFEEEFWPLYPTSANMSKKKAAAVWAKLSAEDRRKAVAAIPGFLAHCRKNPTYQPVYADRFLNERRFDGYVEAAAGGQKPAEPRVDFGGGVSASEPMVVDFLKRGEWLDQWGPRHGQPGCRVPERLIEAAGCADQRGVA